MHGLLLLLLCSYADDTADRANLSGKWQESSSTWVIQENGDSIHVAYLENGQPQSEFTCKIGSECDVKGSRKAKVSLWFNGPKLVQMETRGNEVVKRRFSANGDEMEVEVIPISPDGKAQTVKLKRVK
jgi:hypothetical protein